MTAMEREPRHLKDTPMPAGEASMEAAVSIDGPFCHSGGHAKNDRHARKAAHPLLRHGQARGRPASLPLSYTTIGDTALD